MSQPYIGEIRMFGGTFAPVGYLACSGQLLPIDQYQTLYALIGTTYGGDGVNTFALPNFQGRIPIHQGTGPGLPSFVLGQFSGTETVTLSATQLPVHTHPGNCGGNATAASPAGGLLGTTTGGNPVYAPSSAGSVAPMAPQGGGSTGNNQPHNNMMPFLAVNFIIAVEGTFPTQN